MAIPRTDPLRKVPEPAEQYGARSIRDFKTTESGTVAPHALNTHSGTAASIGAADKGHTHPSDSSIQFTDNQFSNTIVTFAWTSQITLVASPGASSALVFVRAWIVADASAGAWTESSDNLIIEYASGTDVCAFIEAGDLVSASVNFKTVEPLDEIASTAIANQALVLRCTGSNWGGGSGDNTFSIRTWYSLVPAVAFSS